MKKKYIALIITILLSVGVYFLFFYKDKNLKYIPENADIVVLLDVKKATRQYISSLMKNPSKWFENGEKNKTKISISNSGLKVPDFLQVFHLKNTKISEWYAVFEINDQAKFSKFLKSRKFISDGKDRLKNNQFFIKIEGEKCFVGTSDSNFKIIGNVFSEKFRNKNMNAESFMKDGVGSISFISELRTQNFSIHLKDDELEIKNEGYKTDFSSLINDLNEKTQFLQAELNYENIKKVGSFFNNDLKDSISAKRLKIKADLNEINDTIISYAYDDNFNEIEKVSYQKIIQPDYEIQLETSNPEKIWVYFQSKKWINAQNQFTVIPFQPNLISKNKNQVIIKSTRKLIQIEESRIQNFIFVKNNPLLYTSFKTLSNPIFKDVDYIFYGNKNLDYVVKLKFKKDNYPLILR